MSVLTFYLSMLNSSASQSVRLSATPRPATPPTVTGKTPRQTTTATLCNNAPDNNWIYLDYSVLCVCASDGKDVIRRGVPKRAVWSNDELLCEQVKCGVLAALKK